MADSRTTASCLSSINISDDDSSIHSSDYSKSTVSKDGISSDRDSSHGDEQDQESTAVEDLETYVNMKMKGKQTTQKEELQRAGQASFESMSDDEDDQSSASHWASETSSILSSGEEDTDDDDDNQNSVDTTDSERQRYEEARARMLVLKHARRRKDQDLAKQQQLQLQSMRKDETDARVLLQRQQLDAEAARLRKIREAEEARMEKLAQSQRMEAQRSQKKADRRQPLARQQYVEGGRKQAKELAQRYQEGRTRAHRKIVEQKHEEEEKARVKSLAQRRQLIRNEESREQILPTKSSISSRQLQQLLCHQRHRYDDDLSIGTGKSPSKPIVLPDYAGTAQPRKPVHIDLTREEERIPPPKVPSSEDTLPVPRSILEQVRQTQIQRERQEQMEQERLQAKIERQARQAEQNRIMQSKLVVAASPKREDRQYDHEYHGEAEKLRVVTIEPRKFETNEMIDHHKRRLHHSVVPPLVVPAIFSTDDNVSTTGGSIRLYNSMVMNHQQRHAAHNSHLHPDLERGGTPTKSAQSHSEGSGLCGWLSSRTELELFFIFVIMVTLVTLSVLFTLILTGKA